MFVRYQQQKAVCIGRHEEAAESRFAKLIVDNDRQHVEWSDHFFYEAHLTGVHNCVYMLSMRT